MATTKTRSLVFGFMNNTLQKAGHLTGLLLLCSSYFFSSLTIAKEPTGLKEKPFSQHTLTSLKKQFNQQQWLLVLWSVECPACLEELSLIAQVNNEGKTTKNQQLNVVFINTDDDAELTLERQEIIKDKQLTNFQHLYFKADSADRNRYLIDPYWYGELPRSYFFDSKGEFTGKSGLISEIKIRSWLKQPH